MSISTQLYFFHFIKTNPNLIKEIKIPLDAFGGLNLTSELATLSKFRKGEVNLYSEKAEALQSLLFHNKDEVGSNAQLQFLLE